MKKDSHVHLHGCLSPEDLFRFGKETYKERAPFLNWYETEYEKSWGRKPCSKDYFEKENGLELLRKDYLFTKPGSFSQFQACFNLIIALCPIETKRFHVQEHVIRQRNEEGISFFEARTVIPFRFNKEETLEYLFGLSSLVKDLNRKLPMTTKLVITLTRNNKLCEAHYEWVRTFMEKNKDLAEEITGLDFACQEEGHPPHEKKAFFEKVKKDNKKGKSLELLYHVGESFEDKSIVSSIRWVFEAHKMGAGRLGHCIALGIDPENNRGEKINENKEETEQTQAWLLENKELFSSYGFDFSQNDLFQPTVYDDKLIERTRLLQKAILSYFKEQKVVIESCPTSNMKIGKVKKKEFHPLRAFHQAGVKTLIGTDDPGILGTDFEKEQELAHSLMTL